MRVGHNDSENKDEKNTRHHVPPPNHVLEFLKQKSCLNCTQTVHGFPHRVHGLRTDQGPVSIGRNGLQHRPRQLVGWRKMEGLNWCQKKCRLKICWTDLRFQWSMNLLFPVFQANLKWKRQTQRNILFLVTRKTIWEVVRVTTACHPFMTLDNQSINQSINQSKSHSVNHSIDWLIDWSPQKWEKNLIPQNIPCRWCRIPPHPPTAWAPANSHWDTSTFRG